MNREELLRTEIQRGIVHIVSVVASYLFLVCLQFHFHYLLDAYYIFSYMYYLFIMYICLNCVLHCDLFCIASHLRLLYHRVIVIVASLPYHHRRLHHYCYYIIQFYNYDLLLLLVVCVCLCFLLVLIYYI